MTKILGQHAWVGMVKGMGVSPAATRILVNRPELCDYNLLQYVGEQHETLHSKVIEMFVKRLRTPENQVFTSDDIGDVIDLYQKNQRHYNLILNLQEHVKNKLDMSDLTWCLRHNVDLNEYFNSDIDAFD